MLQISDVVPAIHGGYGSDESLETDIGAESDPERSLVGVAADCCDGTDEAAGRCKHTCAQQGQAAREQLQTAAKDAAAGYKVTPMRRGGRMLMASKDEAGQLTNIHEIMTCLLQPTRICVSFMPCRLVPKKRTQIAPEPNAPGRA